MINSEHLLYSLQNASKLIQQVYEHKSSLHDNFKDESVMEY